MNIGKPTRYASFARSAGWLFVLASLLAGCAPALKPTISASPSLNVSSTPPANPSPPSGLLPAYFAVWEPSSATALKDAQGVVMKDYGGSLGVQYQPTSIAQAAIAYYDHWLADTDPAEAAADKAVFLAQTDWLIDNQTLDGRWLFNFRWGNQSVPWWSAMTEGLGMSALLRAYAMTGNPAARTAIERARSTFERDLEHQGVSATVSFGSRSYVVYQEYLKGYEDNVLNGWIFSLVGLYEASTYLSDPQASRDLWDPDRGIAAVRALLPFYDTGDWSRYDMVNPGPSAQGDLDSNDYHSLVINQLRYLGTITGDTFFGDYAKRFGAYANACGTHGGCPPAN